MRNADTMKKLLWMFVPKSRDWLLVLGAAVIVLPVVAVEGLIVGNNLTKGEGNFTWIITMVLAIWAGVFGPLLGSVFARGFSSTEKCLAASFAIAGTWVGHSTLVRLGFQYKDDWELSNWSREIGWLGWWTYPIGVAVGLALLNKLSQRNSTPTRVYWTKKRMAVVIGLAGAASLAAIKWFPPYYAMQSPENRTILNQLGLAVFGILGCALPVTIALRRTARVYAMIFCIVYAFLFNAIALNVWFPYTAELTQWRLSAPFLIGLLVGVGLIYRRVDSAGKAGCPGTWRGAIVRTSPLFFVVLAVAIFLHLYDLRGFSTGTLPSNFELARSLRRIESSNIAVIKNNGISWYTVEITFDENSPADVLKPLTGITLPGWSNLSIKGIGPQIDLTPIQLMTSRTEIANGRLTRDQLAFFAMNFGGWWYLNDVKLVGDDRTPISELSRNVCQFSGLEPGTLCDLLQLIDPKQPPKAVQVNGAFNADDWKAIVDASSITQINIYPNGEKYTLPDSSVDDVDLSNSLLRISISPGQPNAFKDVTAFAMRCNIGLHVYGFELDDDSTTVLQSLPGSEVKHQAFWDFIVCGRGRRSLSMPAAHWEAFYEFEKSLDETKLRRKHLSFGWDDDGNVTELWLPHFAMTSSLSDVQAAKLTTLSVDPAWVNCGFPPLRSKEKEFDPAVILKRMPSLERLYLSGESEDELGEEWNDFSFLGQMPNLREFQFRYDPGHPTAVGNLNKALAGCVQMERLVVIGGIDPSTLAVLAKLKNLKEFVQVDTGFSLISVPKTQALLPGVVVQIVPSELQHSITPADFLEHREAIRKRLVEEYSQSAENKK